MQSNSMLSATAPHQDSAFAAARLAMVDGQIRPNRVSDPRLLDALERVARELFAAPSHQALAYAEGGCLAAPGRSMLAPMVFARMVEALQLTEADSLLDIGGMSGYGATVMAAVAGRVTLLESDPALAAQAERNQQQFGLGTVTIKAGALDRAGTDTYTAMLVEGAVAQIPDAWIAQLAEGGRLVVIIGGNDVSPGTVTLATKLHGSLSRVVLFEAAAPYLPGFAPRQSFSF